MTDAARALARALPFATAVLLAACGGAEEAERPEPAAPPFAAADAGAARDPGRRERDAGAPAAPDSSPEGRWRFARLTRATELRARPDGRRLTRLGRRTEFGSPRVLAVLSERDGWLEVQAAELPNGRSGWIDAAAARTGRTDWSVRVDRSKRRLVLRRGTRRVASMEVAVGRDGNETPLGRFAVTDKLKREPEDPASPYGCCIVALTGHQTRLAPGWPGGDRLAIHHTPAEHTIGRAASLGCLRARRSDIRRLMRSLPLGAPVFVRA